MHDRRRLRKTGGEDVSQREVEIFPLVRLHSRPLARAFYALFHPRRAYRELRAAGRRA